MRTSGKLVRLFTLGLALATPASAQQILENHVTSMVSYKPSAATAHQDIRPQVLQRGVNLDGSLKAEPALPMALAGNPFEGAWVGHERQGSIRLEVGAFGRAEIDIALPCKGRAAWFVGRTYNARQVSSGGSYRDSNSYQGYNWQQTSQPEIVFYDDADNSKDLIYLVYGADRYIEAQRVSSSANQFKAKNGAAGVFDHQSGTPDLWVYTDQVGTKFTFLGFNTTGNTHNGLLWKIEDEESTPNKSYVGHATTVATAISSGWDSAGRITTAYDSSDRRYTYSYTTLDSVVRLTQVKAETKTGSDWTSPGTVTEVARVDYDYYVPPQSFGSSGDLRQVTVTTPLSDSGITSIKKRHYRYWTATWSSGLPGHPHALKYAYDPEGVRRYDWSVDSILNDDQLTATETNLSSYAAAYFEYEESTHRVSKAWFNGECGCSGGVTGTNEYTYETSGATDNVASYDNAWRTRTIVKRPDNTYLTQEFDEAGQAMNRIESDLIPTNSSKKYWVWAVTRDTSGFITDVNTPANVSGYTHSDGSTTKESDAGLITKFLRTSSGNLTGFCTDQKYQKGTGGTAYFDETLTWTSLSKSIGYGSVVRPLVASRREYPVNDSTGTTGSNLVSYTYTSYSGTLQPETLTIDYPAVATANNGSNSATHAYRHMRRDGFTDYEMDPDGHVTYIAFTDGQATTRIEDANTSAGDFSGITVPTTPIDFDTDDAAGMHKKTVTTYDKYGRWTLVSSSFGTSAAYSRSMSYYSRLADQRLVSLQYADYDSGSPTHYGPVQYSVTNQAGKSELEGVIAITGNASTIAQTTHINEDDADPITAVDIDTVEPFDFGQLAQLSTSIYSNSGTQLNEVRDYFLVPASGAGTAGTNYDATKVGYDDSGRQRRVKDASGTIRRTVFDALGRTTESWIGTNDTSWAGGEASGTENMFKTEVREYDGGFDKKNSLLTKVTRRVDSDTSHDRITEHLYDYRGRRVVDVGATSPHAVHKYDSLGRIVATGLYSSSSGLDETDDPTGLTSSRMALSETVYDEMGRSWKQIRHMIDDADGSDDNTLESLNWYDLEGRVLKTDGERLLKTAYDRLGRATDEFVLATDNDTGYADADDVSGDIVLEQYQTRYDTAKPIVLMTVTIQRKHNDISTSETTGALDVNADGGTPDPLVLTSGDLKGRAQITAHWYDQFERLEDTVQYGTNNDTTFTRTGLSVPTRSDIKLRTTYVYNTDGTLQTDTDARALVTKYVYDALGRRTKEIENYSSGVNSGNPYGTDQNVTVAYGYTNGLRTSLTAVMENTANNQVTAYAFGTVKGTSAGESKIATGHLLQKVTYPDSGGSTDVVTYAYNAQEEGIWRQDQAGNVIETEYDVVGRPTRESVTNLASGFDGAIQLQVSSYDSLGRASALVQYDAVTSGSEKDGVKWSYDDWGNLERFEEDRNSAVAASAGDEYDVSYTWAKATTGRNTLRKSGMTMPDARAITYSYRSAGGLHDDENSRVTLVVDGGAVTLAQYDYLGVGTVVRTQLNDVACWSRVFDGSTPPVYVDLDRFNRITTSRWTKDLSTDRDFYQVALTYDEDSNITSAQDNVHGYYNSIGTRWDVKYTMDSVNRLTEAKEGTLSGGSITNPSRDEQWTLSHTGNWDVGKLDLDGDLNFNEAGELNDTRTHNGVNELTGRNTDSSGGDNYTLLHDLAGNLIDDGKDYEYVYDAWNRLRKVNNTGTQALIAEYRYNGLNHRIAVHQDTDTDGDVDSNDKWYYDAFDEKWRLLARYRESDSSPKEDFVPHQAGASGHGESSYIDLVICRNKDTSTVWTAEADGMEERVYLCQNWRADVSAIVSSSGLKEWVKYSAYGVPIGLPGGDSDSDGDIDVTDRTNVQTWIDAPLYDVRGDIDLNGTVDATDKAALVAKTLGRDVLSTTGVANRKGYAGYEALSGLVGGKWLARNRICDAVVGRWLRRDPEAYVDSMNLYALGRARPLNERDPFGAEIVDCKSGSSKRLRAAVHCFASCLIRCLGDKFLQNLDDKAAENDWNNFLSVTGKGPPKVEICFSDKDPVDEKGDHIAGETKPVRDTKGKTTGDSSVVIYASGTKDADSMMTTLAHELKHASQMNDKDHKGKDRPPAPSGDALDGLGGTQGEWDDVYAYAFERRIRDCRCKNCGDKYFSSPPGGGLFNDPIPSPYVLPGRYNPPGGFAPSWR